MPIRSEPVPHMPAGLPRREEQQRRHDDNNGRRSRRARLSPLVAPRSRAANDGTDRSGGPASSQTSLFRTSSFSVKLRNSALHNPLSRTASWLFAPTAAEAARYSRSMAVEAHSELDARAAARRLPDLRAAVPRQAARLPRLGGELAEAAAGARRDDAASTRRRTRTCTAASTSSASARPRRSRARARRRARSSTRPTRARSSSSATRPRRSTSSPTRGGSSNLGPGRRRARDRARAPLELRPVAVRREAHGRRVPADPARRAGRAAARRPRPASGT